MLLQKGNSANEALQLISLGTGTVQHALQLRFELERTSSRRRHVKRLGRTFQVLHQLQRILDITTPHRNNRNVRRLKLQEVHEPVHLPYPDFVLGIIHALVSDLCIVPFVKLDEFRHSVNLQITMMSPNSRPRRFPDTWTARNRRTW